MALNELIVRVDELKREIDKLRPIKADQERRILDKFRLDWNYHSNAIEGNRLTLGETKVLLLEGLTAHGKPLKDSLDIKGHNEVISFLEAFVHKKEILTEVTIRGLHKILLNEPYQVEARTSDGRTTTKWVKLGEYKTEPNFAQSPTGTERPFVLPQDVSAKMQELMDWYKTESDKKAIHPVVIAAHFHHKFVQIHPFDDGNGRMARILMNLILMQNGYQPVIIKTQFKAQYISALIKADVGEITDFLELIAAEEVYSEELFFKGASGEDISDYDDIDKRIALLKQELSNIAEPLELNLQIQTDFFVNTVQPCFSRLTKKLSQFDELYSENTFNVQAQRWSAWNFQSVSGITFRGSLTKDNVMQTLLKETIALNQIMLHSVNFQFYWQGFKRAGLNTFSDSCNILFQFQRHQYTIQASHAQSGQMVFNYSNIYQIPPSEDQLLGIVNGMAEACYKYIEKQVRKKT